MLHSGGGGGSNKGKEVKVLHNGAKNFLHKVGKKKMRWEGLGGSSCTGECLREVWVSQDDINQRV